MKTLSEYESSLLLCFIDWPISSSLTLILDHLCWLLCAVMTNPFHFRFACAPAKQEVRLILDPDILCFLGYSGSIRMSSQEQRAHRKRQIGPQRHERAAEIVIAQKSLENGVCKEAQTKSDV